MEDVLAHSGYKPLTEFATGAEGDLKLGLLIHADLTHVLEGAEVF